MPELIFYNGTILTMNPAQPRATALAVRGERILQLGDEGEILAMARPGTERVDLKGRCLLPGFHDGHVHLPQHGLELGRLQLHGAPTLEAALDMVADYARGLPKGQWLLGAGFSTSRWDVNTLTKEDLDRVAPHQPVLLRSKDHHSAWVNSKALEAAGIGRHTPDPEHGAIERNAGGEPGGLLLERADVLVEAVVPPPDDGELKEALRAAGQDLAELGITTVHHMAADTASYWRQLALLASREDYPLRVWACLNQEDAEHAAAIGVATGQGGERFCVGGAKFFADGALGSLTAWMLKPYTGTAEVGMPVHGPELLAERFPLVIEAGLTPVVHAIGDAANRAVLDAFEAHRPAWQERGLRPRLEHVQHLHPDDAPRLAELGVVASVQPYHLVFDAKRIRALLADRLHHAYPIRTLLVSGAALAFGSDTPVADPDVRLGLQAACRREGPEGDVLGPDEAISAGEALAAYTTGAAFAIGREARSGQLAPGYDADLVVLSHDPSERLDGLRVEGTMLAGRWTKALAGNEGMGKRRP